LTISKTFQYFKILRICTNKFLQVNLSLLQSSLQLMILNSFRQFGAISCRQCLSSKLLRGTLSTRGNHQRTNKNLVSRNGLISYFIPKIKRRTNTWNALLVNKDRTSYLDLEGIRMACCATNAWSNRTLIWRFSRKLQTTQFTKKNV